MNMTFKVFSIAIQMTFTNCQVAKGSLRPLPLQHTEEIVGALREQNVSKVRDLLRKGANANQVDNDGDNLLVLAVNAKTRDKRRQVEIVNLLLKYGAKPHQSHRAGPALESPLHWASRNGCVDVVRRLVGQGAPVNEKSLDPSEYESNHWGRDRTALMAAAASNNQEITRYLIRNGAEVDVRTDVGISPLGTAASLGFRDILRILVEGLDSKASFAEICEREGLLHRACASGSVDTVAYLLRKGAIVGTVNSNGETPLQIAEYDRFVDIVRLLKRAGASRGERPFAPMLACPPSALPDGPPAAKETQSALIATVAEVEPWTWDKPNYSQEGFDTLIRVARILQRTNSRMVEQVLDSPTINKRQSFLVLRAMFELPEAAPLSMRMANYWDGSDAAVGGDRVNMCWPLSWKGGTPRLLARYEGYSGPRYLAVREYRFFRSRFRFRRL